MRLIHVQKRNGLERKGFTLIELLVVITIIGILMALTLGVISRIYAFLDETKVVAEVNRLAQGCEQFKSTFGRYPPSKILLCQVADNGSGTAVGSYRWAANQPALAAIAGYSTEYLSSIFPGINLNLGHQWSGGTPITNGYIVLEGQQCLVYFLGGIRYGSTSAGTGFNTDKTNPTLQTNGARLGGFYDFDEARIVSSGTGTAAFPAYKDVYGTAYAYFASRFQGMSNYPNLYFPITSSTPNDCPTLTNSASLAFVPYFNGSVPSGSPLPYSNWGASLAFKFHKSDTFQIISAGKDKQFGTGGQYNQIDPEQSLFIPAAVLAAAPYSLSIPANMTELLQANYDNITNVTNGRVVPK